MCLKTLLLPFIKLCIISAILLFPDNTLAQECCLKNAHAHNDYKHKHPLSDALKHQFGSIEADVFLIRNKLIVSHIHPLLKKHNTLEKLYLQPLLDSCQKNNGYVYANCKQSITLLIDIKSDAEVTYYELKKVLKKYQSILSCYENGKVIIKGVTIILSGHKPYLAVQNDSIHYVFIDQSLLSLDNPVPKSLCSLASTRYSNVWTWKGKGELPKEEKEKLIALVNQAHQQGKIVRLWASPENETVWTELLNCGVDLINTDNLKGLEDFLLKNKK